MRHCGAQFPETQTRNEMTAELRGDQRLELQYPLPGYLLDIKELFQSWVSVRFSRKKNIFFLSLFWHLQIVKYG
jgi:hypothetical protein